MMTKCELKQEQLQSVTVSPVDLGIITLEVIIIRLFYSIYIMFYCDRPAVISEYNRPKQTTHVTILKMEKLHGCENDL